MAVDQTIESSEVTDALPGDLTAILRHHREEHGLNVNQVAEALCLSPKIITALEAEKLDELPEPPYVRGYLRSFAKFTEVDPAEMINAYEKLRGAKPNELDYHFANSPATNQRKRGISSGILKFGLLIVLLGLLAILSMIPGVRDWASTTWSSFSQQSDPGFTATNQNDNPLLTGNIPPPLPINEDGATGDTPVEGEAASTDNVNTGFPSVADAPVSADATTDTEANATTPETEAATEETETAEGSESADDTETDTASVEVPEGSSALKLVFNDEVWMRIRDSEKKKLFEALSQKGDTKELVLPKPMEIRVGNAQSLELTVDGKPFDLAPFTRGSVANFTIE